MYTPCKQYQHLQVANKYVCLSLFAYCGISAGRSKNHGENEIKATFYARLHFM